LHGSGGIRDRFGRECGYYADRFGDRSRRRCFCDHIGAAGGRGHGCIRYRYGRSCLSGFGRGRGGFSDVGRGGFGGRFEFEDGFRFGRDCFEHSFSSGSDCRFGYGGNGDDGRELEDRSGCGRGRIRHAGGIRYGRRGLWSHAGRSGGDCGGSFGFRAG